MKERRSVERKAEEGTEEFEEFYESEKGCSRKQGPDQIRQAFSKRKRGLALKAYQLYKITDSKVRLKCRLAWLCPFKK